MQPTCCVNSVKLQSQPAWLRRRKHGAEYRGCVVVAEVAPCNSFSDPLWDADRLQSSHLKF